VLSFDEVSTNMPDGISIEILVPGCLFRCSTKSAVTDSRRLFNPDPINASTMSSPIVVEGKLSWDWIKMISISEC
jgi:hypothetical protein